MPDQERWPGAAHDEVHECWLLSALLLDHLHHHPGPLKVHPEEEDGEECCPRQDRSFTCVSERAYEGGGGTPRKGDPHLLPNTRAARFQDIRRFSFTTFNIFLRVRSLGPNPVLRFGGFCTFGIFRSGKGVNGGAHEGKGYHPHPGAHHRPQNIVIAPKMVS